MRLSLDFRQRCETLAVECRTKLGLNAFDRLPADRLLKELDGAAITPDKIKEVPVDIVTVLLQQDDWSASIVWINPLIILYNPRHVPTRYEADVMHELAHVLLKHPMVKFSADGKPARNDRYELEAVYLGGCLQIPRRGLLWAVQNQCSITQIAKHFGSSEAMVRYRANVTSVLPLV